MIEVKIPLEMLDPTTMSPPMNTMLITDGVGLDKLGGFLARVEDFGFDYETNVVEFYMDRFARTMQFGNRNEQYVVDLLALCDMNTEKLMAAQGNFGQNRNGALKHLVNTVQPHLASRKVKLGQNLGFEYGVSWWNFGMRIFSFYDCMYAEKVILAGKVRPFSKGYFALDDLVAKYIWKTLDKTLQMSFDLENTLTHEQVVYAALDTRLPYGIRDKQVAIMRRDRLEQAAQIEFEAIGSFEDMHINGFYLNAEAWSALVNGVREEHKKNLARLDEFFVPLVGAKGQLELRLDELEQIWRDTPNKTSEDKARRAENRKAWMEAKKKNTANEKNLKTYEGEAAINYGSPIQLHDTLLKVPGINRRNLAGTDDDTLKNLTKDDTQPWVPMIEAIREFRTSEKKLSTYGDEWLKWINPRTGRVHSRFNQIGTETGRASSAKPNLYNLPKEPEVRACWQRQPQLCAEMLALLQACYKKYDEMKAISKILKIDMSGAELRILAELADAISWLEAFAKDWDIHAVSTEILYPERWPTLTIAGCAYFEKDHQKCKCPEHSALRNGTKATNFLIINGGGPKKLSTDLGCEYDTAMSLMNIHRAKFPDVWGYLDRSGQYAVQNMETRGLSGRRRQFVRPTWDQAVAKTEKDLKRPGSSEEVRKTMRGLFGMIERAGKNAPLQMSNADIAKIAMGSGFDDDGTPFLWHRLLPEFGARMVNFVYDEFVLEFPEENEVALIEAVADAIKRAGRKLLKKVSMESDWVVDDVWRKE